MKPFHVNIDRLKGDHSESIREEVNSSFLDISEPDLSFPEKIVVTGKAYLADDHLILRLHIATTFTLCCSICNEPVFLPLEIENFTHSEALENMRGPIFDYTPLLRTAVLLELPAFAECDQGNCPERKNIKKYLKQPTPPPTNTPFKNL